LRRHRIRRLEADQVLAKLRSTALRVSTATTDATVAAIGLLLPQLRLVHAQRRDCGSRIVGLLKAEMAPPKGKAGQHSDAAVLDSLPGIGRAVLARMLTEGAEAIRHRDLNRLRTLGGSAPVTKRSGKACRVEMRRACNPRLRFAYYHWARIAVQKDAHSQRHYQALRARGHSHGRALRSVADRLLAVAVAMLKAGTLYDPSLRGQGRSGAARLANEPRASSETTG
jgi:transposase